MNNATMKTLEEAMQRMEEMGPSRDPIYIKPTTVYLPNGVEVTDEQVRQLTGNDQIQIIRMP